MNINDKSKSFEKQNDVFEPPKQKAISPAILGVPSSYGVKFSLNVTSQKKKELLCKLEEWRKAREQKLASSILSKHKQSGNSNLASLTTLKNKATEQCPLSANNFTQQNQKSSSVFERLYKNSAKFKSQANNCAFMGQKLQSNFSTNSKAHLTSNDFKSSKLDKHDKTVEGKNERMSYLEEKQVKKDIESFGNSNQIISQKKNLTETENWQIVTENKAEDKAEMANANNLNFITNFEETFDFNKFKNNDTVKSSQFKGKNKMPHLKSSRESYKIRDQNNGWKLECDFKYSKSAIITDSKNESNKFKNTLRRSISMLHLKKHNADMCKHAVYRTKSENLNLHTIGSALNDSKKLYHSSVLKSNKKNKTNKPLGAGSLNPPKLIPLETPTCLRKKLEDWLKVNGHSLEKYRHLRCFGIQNESVLQYRNSEKSTHQGFNASPIEFDDSDKENVMAPASILENADVENWLKELHRLIVDLKYPSERCEEWLAAIKNKSPACTQMRMYWECLAALDAAKDSSVCNPQKKDSDEKKSMSSPRESLAKLFDKMVIEREVKPKLEKGLDPKNIFKSTVIKFAVQQKPLKESAKKTEQSSQKYIATPVRRSSRIRTPCKIHVVSSLQSLTPDVRNNTTFKPNESLLNGE